MTTLPLEVAGEAVRVSKQLLERASDLAERVNRTAVLYSPGEESEPVVRNELLHAAIERGLAEIALDIGVGSSDGDSVFVVDSVRHEPRLGVLLEGRKSTPGVPLPLRLRIGCVGVTVELRHEGVDEVDPAAATLVVGCEGRTANELSAALAPHAPFPMAAPGVPPTWVAVNADLSAFRQAPHSTRRSPERRREHFEQLHADRARSLGRVVVALLAHEANRGDHPSRSVGAASFCVGASVFRALTADVRELPLAMALRVIRTHSVFEALVGRLHRWRKGSSVQLTVAGVGITPDPVFGRISRVSQTKRFRYDYVPEVLEVDGPVAVEVEERTTT